MAIPSKSRNFAILIRAVFQGTSSWEYFVKQYIYILKFSSFLSLLFYLSSLIYLDTKKLIAIYKGLYQAFEKGGGEAPV